MAIIQVEANIGIIPEDPKAPIIVDVIYKTNPVVMPKKIIKTELRLLI